MKMFRRKVNLGKLKTGHKVMIWITAIMAIGIFVGVHTEVLNLKTIITLMVFQIIWILVTGAVIISTTIE